MYNMRKLNKFLLLYISLIYEMCYYEDCFREMRNKEIGDMSFTILGRSGRARTGVFRLPHGNVETPIFMPVGTQGTIKGLLPRQVAETGCRILLCRLYLKIL